MSDGTSSSLDPGSGIREPVQARSLESFRRFVDATESLLVEGGAEAVTVQEVVDRAGGSVGSFYARFESRETLVHHVQDRFWSSLEERWEAHFEAERARGGRPIEVLARFTRLLVRLLSAGERGRLRAFLALALAEPETALTARVRGLDTRIVEGAGRLLEETLDADGEREEAAVAPREIARRILGCARDAVLFDRPGREQERRLILTLVRLGAAGLELDPPRDYGELLRLCR